MRWCDPGMGGIQLNDQKDNGDGANGGAAHSISPRQANQQVARQLSLKGRVQEALTEW